MPEFRLVPLNDEADVQFVYDARRHPAVCAFLFGVPPESLATHKAWLIANVPGKRLMYVLKADGVPVGYCHAYDFDHKENTVEAGFVIHPDFQGKGYGKVIVSLFAGELSQKLSGWRVYLNVKENNVKALHVYETQGYVRLFSQVWHTVDEVGTVVMEKQL